MRRALAIAQVALVVVLLTGAGLLLRSYAKVLSAPMGFSPSTVTASMCSVRRLRRCHRSPF